MCPPKAGCFCERLVEMHVELWVPYLWRNSPLSAFLQSSVFRKNTEEKLPDEFGPFFSEPDFLLREELRDVENQYAVLAAVASGNARLIPLIREV